MSLSFVWFSCIHVHAHIHFWLHVLAKTRSIVSFAICHVNWEPSTRGKDSSSGINNGGSSNPDSKIHGAIMGPNWGRQDPGWPHVGPMSLAIWGNISERKWDGFHGYLHRSTILPRGEVNICKEWIRFHYHGNLPYTQPMTIVFIAHTIISPGRVYYKNDV